MASFGWIWWSGFADIDFGGTPHVERWFDALYARAGVARTAALFSTQRCCRQVVTARRQPPKPGLHRVRIAGAA
jgi:hypothetical protein